MIVKDAHTCGGKPRIEGTRIAVHDLVANLRHHGGDIDALLAEFPDLSRFDVSDALAYYESHSSEIDKILTRREKAYRAGLNRSRNKRRRDLATAAR